MDAGALLDLLGNENRRRILRLLSRKPCYVTEISEHIGVSPKAVIDHLRRLEDAGVIESQTNSQRRKYFHIAENLRLEVTVAPYGFGMKSAYPANPSLDISRCKYLSLEVSRPAETSDEIGQGMPRESPNGGITQQVDPAAITQLARELDELSDIERELSLAQRWVQGRISGVLNSLAEITEDDSYVDAEILAAVARGTTRTSEISSEVDVPLPVVEECLVRLADRGIVTQNGDEWRLE